MKKSLISTIALMLSLGLAGCMRRTSGPAADTILFNGNIVTVDANFGRAQAIAVGGGRILAVGTNDDIRKMADAHTRSIDARGRTVIPGLIDAHIHDAGEGPGVDFSKARSLDDVLQAIAKRVKQSRPGDLIVSNAGWHEGQLREQRLPLRRELDQVAPTNPVVVRRGGQQYILNSAALKKWNITKATPEPPNGQVGHYDDGELNGELRSQALQLAPLPAPPTKTANEQIQDLQNMFDILHARGVTSIRIPGGSLEQYRLLQEMHRRGVLTMRVNFLFLGREYRGTTDLGQAMDSWKVRPDEGDAWLRVGGVKLFMDGAYEGAYMREPYAEPYGKNGTYRGIQLVPTDTFMAMVREINKRGFEVAVHTLGDAALDTVLAAFDQANRDKPITNRHFVIEHAFLVRPDQIPRINRLGVWLGTQRQLYIAAPSMKRFWGGDRAKATNQLRTLLDSDVKIAGGTDIDGQLLPTYYHYVTRNTISDGVYDASQRITRQEALRLLTINNAALTFEDHIKGSLEPGKVADLVMLSADILTCPADDILNVKPILTMEDGKIVYENAQ